MDQDLKGFQRAELFRQAHHRVPVAAVGKQGLSEELVAHVERELSNHELIKVRFSDFKEGRRELAKQIAERTNAHFVGLIGFIAILYKMHPDANKRRVHFPET